MNLRLLVCVSMLALVWSAVAQAAVDLSVLDKGMAGPRTQVLVLGSAHLSQAPKDFKLESLKPLLDRLAAYKPTIITIEALSGETCDRMARLPALYDPKDVQSYCWNTPQANAETGLDIPAAIAAVKKTLHSWPAHPTPAERRHLAVLFLASGDPASAVVQWLQLPQAERHAGNDLDDALAKKLDDYSHYRNENMSIAAHLAARLGLQRVYPVDDHTGDSVPIDNFKAYGKAIEKAWSTRRARGEPIWNRENELEKAGKILALYRTMNDPANLQTIAEVDMGAALTDTSPEHYGQLYVAGWETRNLRMVSNVRFAFGAHPGARVLCLIGASHKPWFDKLLGLMQGVDIVDAEKVLREP